MKIAVLIKQIPLNAQAVFNEDNSIDRAASVKGMNPADRCALLHAVALAGEVYTVTAVAMGPASAEDTLRALGYERLTWEEKTRRGNVLDLDTRKQNTYSADAAQWDTTPTAGSTKPVTSGGIKSALDDKQDELTLDSTPTASSSNPVRSGGVKSYADAKILYFYQQSTVATQAATTEFCRITDSRIDANTVVLNLGYSDSSLITSGVSWISAAGYISFKGICTSSNCKVNAVLGQKGN